MYRRTLACSTLALAMMAAATGCGDDAGGVVVDGGAERPTDGGMPGLPGDGRPGEDAQADAGRLPEDAAQPIDVDQSRDEGQPSDGSQPADAGAGLGSDGSNQDVGAPAPDVQPDLAPPSGVSPPTPSPAAIKILPGLTDLLGSFETGCTFGPGAERWCAVSRPLSLSTRELWFVNVSKAAAARSLISTCDIPGTCVKASDNVYTAQPDSGPAYPEDSARASGNTFTYLADARSAPSDPFEGDVWVHTVGSPNTTQIGLGVFDCAVTGQRLIEGGKRQIDKVVGICAGNPSSFPGDPVNFFTLKGGVVAGQTPAAPAAPLNRIAGLGLGDVQRINPVHPATTALRWRVGFTADSETLLLSTGGATEAEVEKLYTFKSDDLGKLGVVGTPFPGGDNVTRWTLSADGKKIYFLKEYNYNAMGNQSGTLWVADFPNGANARELRSGRVPGGSTGGVGAYRILVDAKGTDQGVGALTNLIMGRGTYSIIKDTAGGLDDAANVPLVTPRTRSLPLASPDLRFSLFAQEFDMTEPTSDIWVARNDGTGQACPMTGGVAGGIFGFPFSQSGNLVLWNDNYDPATLSADAFYADAADCNNASKKKRFSSHADFWFVDADRMLLYSDDSNGAQVSLKYAWINGASLSAPVTIQERADRFFQIVLDAQPTDGSPPRFKGIVYTLSGGSETVNGAYYYELPATP